MHLESRKIIIRQFNSSDLPDLSILLSSDYVAKWMPGWFKSSGTVDDWLLATIDSYYDDDGLEKDASYAVVEKESEALIGRADFIIHDDDLIEIAIVLKPNYIEKGHLTESYKMLIEYLKDKHKDKQIEIISNAENILETKAIEKLGAFSIKTNRIEETKTFNHYTAQRGTPL